MDKHTRTARKNKDTARMRHISGANEKDYTKDYITGSNMSAWKRRNSQGGKWIALGCVKLQRCNMRVYIGCIPVQGMIKKVASA